MWHSMMFSNSKSQYHLHVLGTTILYFIISAVVHHVFLPERETEKSLQRISKFFLFFFFPHNTKRKSFWLRHNLFIQLVKMSRNEWPLNPDALVGKRVEMEWSQGKVYKGKVTRYSANTRVHTVFYDDGEEKYYDMFSKTFRIVRSFFNLFCFVTITIV